MGSVLLITGAGGGLGSAVAMDRKGHFDEIVLLGRTKAPLEALSRKLDLSKSSVHLEVADVTHPSEVESALASFTRIDGLVNAAGVLGPVRKFGDESWEDWSQAISVNLVGNASVCHCALPKLVASRRGKIVNFAGGGAAWPRVFHSAYASSKAAVVRFTEILAAEHPELDANAIAPGAHNTGIWKGETHDKPPAKWADLGRFCSTVAYLLSEESDGISGKFIHINDKWEEFTPGISAADIYTLRRIEPKR
jgi:NAD(P)-dependent dehydrogenase (short-subunit alcohol dehydrogenase family)